MKLKNTLPIILALLILFVVFAWPGRAARPDTPRQQWEYKREVFQLRPQFREPDKPESVEKRLAELGAEGWELVAYYPEGGSVFMGLYVFKRQK
jgi:hypothetical protein